MNIIVTRRWQAPDNAEYRASTTGVVTIDSEQICFSLERTETLMPEGTFPVKMAWSNRFQRMTPHIDIPLHSNVEMHGANTAEDVDGCIGCAENRLSDYRIYESKPATDSIEELLNSAEANGEESTVTISHSVQPTP